MTALLLAALTCTPPACVPPDRVALRELHRRNVRAPKTAEEDRVWVQGWKGRGR